MTATERVAELLRARGAATIDHPGGTLDAHLVRVQQLLARLGASPRLQLAGRAHAVYGTDGFDIALMTLDERPLLTDIVGQDVEGLVYRYGACDRAKTWRELPASRRVWNRFTGAAEYLGDDELREFVDLSLVNELDVAEHSPGFVEEHGDYFRWLTASWQALLSPAVVAEAERVLDRVVEARAVRQSPDLARRHCGR
jgi:hypothetical protein